MNPNTGELMELRDAQVPDGFERLRGRFIERIAQQELQRARGAGHETAHVNLNSQHPLAVWAKKKRKAKIAAASRRRNRHGKR